MPKVTPLSVDAHDLANLRESGLKDSTIRANGLRTEGSALIFPYRNLDGEVNCFCRIRPHEPRVIDGRTAKYVQPKGSPVRAYFPKESLDNLREAGTSILITEGEKKALKLAQEGYAAIGLGGVDCWGKDGELIPDLAAIDWSGRDAYIAFDYDEKMTTRQNVARSMQRLANALRAMGVREVYAVDLPPGPDGGKQGVDDFLVAHGAQALGQLIEQALPVPVDGFGNTVIKIIPLAPPELGAAACHGFIGDFVRAVAPYTEATDAGIIAHLLPAIGTLIGPTHYVWAGNKQFPRINAVLVGRTNSGRKGTSLAPVDMLMERVNRDFWNRQRVNGLSSGEGLIAYVADKKEKDEDGNLIEVAVEKRLIVIEEEFSRVLANMGREGNILSQIGRSAFDSGNLATLTVNPRHATGAHISIVGHITPEELKERLTAVEMANGFGNRFLWFAVESDKVMPRTVPIPDSVFIPFEPRLRTLLLKGGEKKERSVELSVKAASRWEEIYLRLREDQPGLAGQMVARGANFVLRLALIYSLLESKPNKIEVKHLEAALAIWDYCAASAHLLFHSETGDKLADKLLALLANGPMTKDDFNKHLSQKQKSEVGQLLEKLEAWKLIRKSSVKHPGAGRPATQWERT